MDLTYDQGKTRMSSSVYDVQDCPDCDALVYIQDTVPVS